MKFEFNIPMTVTVVEGTHQDKEHHDGAAVDVLLTVEAPSLEVAQKALQQTLQNVLGNHGIGQAVIGQEILSIVGTDR